MNASLDPAPAHAPRAHGPTDHEFAYRPIARSAVIACLLGIMSVVTFLDPTLALIPALGVATGAFSLWTIRRQSTDWSGEGLALAGIVLSAVCWLGGWSFTAYVRLVEVPEGCTPISYDELQPDPQLPHRLPESALALDGKAVFVKGYMYPGRKSRGLREFILCYNNDECCFGGTPPVTHMIRVTLEAPLSVDFSRRVRKVAGVFHVHEGGTVDGLSGALYHIEASSIQ